jgi:hypothetical protein
MPTPTYTPLATVTLGSSAASVTFSSIPATYRDLILVYTGLLSVGDENVLLNVNGTGTTGTRVFMFGSGSTATSGTATTLTIGFPGGALSSTILQIFDYSATDKHKTMLFRGNNTNSGVSAQAQRWANTAAITSLAFSPAAGTFNSASTFNLYGVIS